MHSKTVKQPENRQKLDESKLISESIKIGAQNTNQNSEKLNP